MTEQKEASDDLASILRLIAERAGKVVLAYYVEGEEIAVKEKEDSSPVTEADEACEAFILEALRTMTPFIPIVSEEAASDGKTPEVDPDGLFWLVDPLDGTKEFISRNGEFTVNIALIEKGVPIAGVVHAPALAMTWTAAEGIAEFSQTDHPPMQISCRPIPEEGAVAVASRRHGSGDKLDAFLAKHQVGETVSAGSSIKFCLLASGKADLYPRFGRTMEWDTAAGQAVLMAAGGSVEDTLGKPLRYGKLPIFENPEFIAYGKR